MSDARCQIRPAGVGDAAAVADLAAGLAQSSTFSRAGFDRNYPALLASGHACLLLAVDGHDRLGYLLGFKHLTFYPNGPVAWVEEVFVRGQHRGRGGGRDLMNAFEQWAAARDCVLVALATRRAAPFTRPWDTNSPPSTIGRSWAPGPGSAPQARAADEARAVVPRPLHLPRELGSRPGRRLAADVLPRRGPLRGDDNRRFRGANFPLKAGATGPFRPDFRASSRPTTAP